MGIFTTHPSQPFLPTLKKVIGDEVRTHPLSLASYTIYLPTRRAARQLRSLFLCEGAASALPRIHAFDEIGVHKADRHNAPIKADEFSVLTPQRMDQILRALIFPIVSHHLGFNMSEAMGMKLVEEVRHFMEELQREGISLESAWENREPNFARETELGAKIFSVLQTHWSKILAEEKALPAMYFQELAWKDRLVEWHTKPPANPIIIAGFTGLTPLIREIMYMGSLLPKGRLVLVNFSTAYGHKVGENHPQYIMQRFLETYKISPTFVQDLSRKPNEVDQAIHSFFLEPHIANLPSLKEGILPKISYAQTAHSLEEAELIAQKLRAVVEDPHKTAILVTPNRGLARKVRLQMKRWGIEIDDSAGSPYSQTPSGQFILLSAALLTNASFSMVDLLALLKHPLCGKGFERATWQRLIQWVEKDIIRPSLVSLTLKEVVERIQIYPFPEKEEKEAVEKFKRWFSQLLDFQKNMDPLMSRKSLALADLLSVHKGLISHLICMDSDNELLISEDTGGGQATSLWQQLDKDLRGINIPHIFQYVSYLRGYLKYFSVRPSSELYHPRIKILGVVEARLFTADVVIIGSLNEEIWEGTGRVHWFSDRQRAKIGLPTLQQREGIVAHDFIQLLSAKEIVLTRAATEEGSPSTPSRFLEVLLAHLGRQGGSVATLKKAHKGSQEGIRGRNFGFVRPQPKPPLAMRPTKMALTDVGPWLLNPYEVYAKYILKLRPLPSIESEDISLRFGIMIHSLLAELLPLYRGSGKNIETLEPALVKSHIRKYFPAPAEARYYKEKAERICQWVKKRLTLEEDIWQKDFLEIKGALTLSSPKAHLTIEGRADRLTLEKNGTLHIIDYKTGTLPSLRKIQWGHFPQLTLEAAMALQKGFSELSSSFKDIKLSYWLVNGRKEGGEVVALRESGKEMAKEAYAGLQSLFHQFYVAESPYEATVHVSPAYKHLSRVQEWQYVTNENA